MNKNTEIELELAIEKTISSLNDMQRATLSPFFYTRIKARIEEKKDKWTYFARIISQPLPAVSTFLLLLLINGLVILTHNQSNQTTTAQNTDQIFDTEYATMSFSLDPNIANK